MNPPLLPNPCVMSIRQLDSRIAPKGVCDGALHLPLQTFPCFTFDCDLESPARGYPGGVNGNAIRSAPQLAAALFVSEWFGNLNKAPLHGSILYIAGGNR